jgi:hypothetical protein
MKQERQKEVTTIISKDYSSMKWYITSCMFNCTNFQLHDTHIGKINQEVKNK